MNVRPEPMIAATLDPDAPVWPQVAQLLGTDAATALSRDFGGRRLYVPRSVGSAHPIAVSVGRKAAGRLCEFMAGQNLEPPIGAGKRARILELTAGGMQRARVARVVGCTERYVYQVIAETKDDRQGDLFSRDT